MASKTGFFLLMETFWRENTEVMMMFHRSTLMAAGASQGVASNPWLVNETDETKGLTFGEIKQQQQRIIDGNYT